MGSLRIGIVWVQHYRHVVAAVDTVVHVVGMVAVGTAAVVRHVQYKLALEQNALCKLGEALDVVLVVVVERIVECILFGEQDSELEEVDIGLEQELEQHVEDMELE